MAEVSRFRRAWPLLGSALWLAGAVGFAVASRVGQWPAGIAVLVASAWVLVLVVVSREALRDLFGPVFTYEILRLGRRRLTFVLRFLYVLAIVGLLALLYATWMARISRYGSLTTVRPSELAGFAATFFEAFAAIQFAVALLLTPAYVAGSIADEKERRTLEFLLATDLKNREIIFGKLAARIANLLMYVLAGIPVLAFLQLFGGIDPELALSAAASTAITVLGLAALSIFCSTVLSTSRGAMAAAYSALFGYLAFSAIAGILARTVAARFQTPLISVGGWSLDNSDIGDAISSGNLISTVLLRTSGGRDLSEDVIAGILRDYAIFWGIASAALIGAAVLRLRTVALAQGRGDSRSAMKPSARIAMGDDPILWREVFTGHRRAGWTGWVFRILIVGLLAVIPGLLAYQAFYVMRAWRGTTTFADQWEQLREGMSLWVRMASGFLSLLLFFGAALRGAASISGERDRDTWLSLISAPITPWEVLRGKFLGAVLGMRFFYGLLLVVWAIGLAMGATNILSLPLAILHIALYTSAFALLGMFCSATARTTLVASIRAFGAAFFCAGGFWLFLLLCCALPLNFAGGTAGRSLELGSQFILGFTPTFMAGYFPMDSSLSEDNFGPFASRRSYSVGPVAPFLGFVAWVAITALLGVAVLRRVTTAMNRNPISQRLARRPSR